jgi:hypothetical protein
VIVGAIRIASWDARIANAIFSTAQLVVALWVIWRIGVSDSTISIIALPVFATSLWRSLTIRIVLEEERLVIRNFWRSHTVPWSRVVRASITALWPSPLTLLSLGRIVTLKVADRAFPIGIQALLGRPNSRAVARFEAEARRHGVEVKHPF